jgi:hypothetical protein
MGGRVGGRRTRTERSWLGVMASRLIGSGTPPEGPIGHCFHLSLAAPPVSRGGPASSTLLRFLWASSIQEAVLVRGETSSIVNNDVGYVLTRFRLNT